MNYSQKPSMCRVDIFKETGKWYTTLEVDFSNQSYNASTVDVVKDAIKNEVGNGYSGMWAVCLEPYCSCQFPVMIKL
jgi:hypothetical protein